MSSTRQGAYGPEDDIVDYILGITFEIWEERGVELIRQYYSDDCVVFGLDGITHGAAEVVDATWATLEAFPDRNLLAESVIWSGDTRDGYTSHRLSSRATNRGATQYGSATNKPIRMTNIADCVIEDGVIVREWLVRDNMVLAKQLGADPLAAAQRMAANRSDELGAWLASEHERVSRAGIPETPGSSADPREAPEAFARSVLGSCWSGDRAAWGLTHAPYSVMHRGPYSHHSGSDAIFSYYQNLRRALGTVSCSVDHVAFLPIASNGVDIAARWTVAGSHDGELMGVAATGKPILIMGVTHWHCFAGRIVSEHTVFDDLAVLSQAFVE